ELGLIQAGIADKVFGNNSPERVAERAQRAEHADASLQGIFALVASGDGPGAANALAQAAPAAPPKEPPAATLGFSLSVAHCQTCRQGELIAMRVTGQGKQMRTERHRAAPVSAPVVEALLSQRPS